MQTRQMRVRVLKSGRILLNNGAQEIACVVRNVSLGGAGVELPAWVDLPPVFVIEATGWPPRLCRTAWREGDRMGIQFMDPMGEHMGDPASPSEASATPPRPARKGGDLSISRDEP